jgi:hypothetical protein
MKRPLMIGLAAFGVSTLALLAYGFVASDRFASVPDPATIRDAFARADSVALRVSGQSTPKPIGFFLKDRESLEKLARLIDFDGRPERSTEANYGTAETIQARIVRNGQPAEIFTLIGARVLLYGPDGKYTVHLKDERFDQAVRAMTKPNPPTP